jgi:hypothetical protein
VMEVVAAIDRTLIEGIGVTIAAMIFFCGSIYLLLAAVFGLRMGYLVAATGFFAFFILLAAIWAFGAPGTLPFLGPKGSLATWEPLAAGEDLRSPTFRIIDQYPGGPWEEPTEGNRAQVELVTTEVQEFLAEEAGRELRQAGLEGEVEPAEFQVTEIRFAEVGETRLAAATVFPATGGRTVEVVAHHVPGNIALPSYVALGIAVVGFLVHVPFLDRAERRRKDVLTGGEQAPWRGPA